VKINKDERTDSEKSQFNHPGELITGVLKKVRNLIKMGSILSVLPER